MRHTSEASLRLGSSGRLRVSGHCHSHTAWVAKMTGNLCLVRGKGRGPLDTQAAQVCVRGGEGSRKGKNQGWWWGDSVWIGSVSGLISNFQEEKEQQVWTDPSHCLGEVEPAGQAGTKELRKWKASSPLGECDWIQRPHNLKLGVANMIPATQYAVRKLFLDTREILKDPKTAIRKGLWYSSKEAVYPQ